MDLGAAALTLHFKFVHHLVDEINTAPMFGEDVLAMSGTGDCGRVRPGPRIAHDDKHAVRLAAGYAALHLAGAIVLATVLDGVGKRFTQRRLDLELLSLRAF